MWVESTSFTVENAAVVTFQEQRRAMFSKERARYPATSSYPAHFCPRVGSDSSSERQKRNAKYLKQETGDHEEQIRRLKTAIKEANKSIKYQQTGLDIAGRLARNTESP